MLDPNQHTPNLKDRMPNLTHASGGGCGSERPGGGLLGCGARLGAEYLLFRTAFFPKIGAWAAHVGRLATLVFSVSPNHPRAPPAQNSLPRTGIRRPEIEFFVAGGRGDNSCEIRCDCCNPGWRKASRPGIDIRMCMARFHHPRGKTSHASNAPRSAKKKE